MYTSHCLLKWHWNLPQIVHLLLFPAHTSTYSRSSDGLYTCKVCNKSFGDNFKLLMHYWPHTGERSHMLMSVGSVSHRSVNLIKTHALVHMGECSHLCTDCGKRFRRAAHLQKHALLHTGQRPHVCNVCCMRDWSEEPHFYTQCGPALWVRVVYQDICNTSSTAETSLHTQQLRMMFILHSGKMWITEFHMEMWGMS